MSFYADLFLPLEFGEGILHKTSGEHRNWWSVILRDVHFWVPVLVLVGGLLVLRWIS